MKTAFRTFTLGLAVTAAAVTGWGANAFTENMGTPASNTLIVNYTGFQNSSTAGITFSGSGDVRTSSASGGYPLSSGSGNVYLGPSTSNPTTPRTFIISGINLSAAATRKFSFGVSKSTNAATGSDFTVEYSTDSGSSWNALTYPALPTTGSGWFLRTTDTDLPQAANVSIRFSSLSTGVQYRIDDVVIGDIPTPPPAIDGTCASVKAAANGTRFQNVHGIVTSVGGNYGRLQFTIQDGTVGLLIDSPSATAYTQPNIGDDVTIGVASRNTSSGSIVLQPEGTGSAAFTVNSSGNPLPAPVTYGSVAEFLAANTIDIQGLRVQICNVYLDSISTADTAKVGDTTWLASAQTAGAAGLVFTDDGTAKVTVYVTNDLHGKLDDWKAKIRPATADSNDRVNVIAVGAQYNNVNQISVNDPVGTAAKTDEAGPIAPAKKAAVNEWSLY